MYVFFPIRRVGCSPKFTGYRGVHFRLVQNFLEFYIKSTEVALDPGQSFIVIECGKLENRY